MNAWAEIFNISGLAIGPNAWDMMAMGGAATIETGGGASAFASYAAPAGYRWDFVTLNGVRVTQNNEPVVALARAA